MSRDNRPPSDPLPEFATREEEAEFWDTHDFTDYWDELEPVNLPAGPNLASSILVPLDGESLSQTRQHGDAESDPVWTTALDHVKAVRPLFSDSDRHTAGSDQRIPLISNSIALVTSPLQS